MAELAAFAQASSLTTEACEVCQQVAQSLIEAWKKDGVVKPKNYMEWDLGSWQDFWDRKWCIDCQNIVRYFEADTKRRAAFGPECTLKLYSLSDKFHLYALVELDGEESQTHISVDPDKVDISKLMKWSVYCQEKHGGSCLDLPEWKRMPPPANLIFIDILNSCLVRLEGNMKENYTTLSYVWGKVSGTLELKLDNWDLFSTKGFLERSEHRIPKTIRDAIKLTASLGLRYLWVDRLCIVQDDPVQLNHQLAQMAAVYANSYCTIIAVDGIDADHGLPGIHPDSPRPYAGLSFGFTNQVTMARPLTHESKSPLPYWHTRAWTFQERAVSSRCLVFTGNSVYWSCRSATWLENIVADPDEIEHTAHSMHAQAPLTSEWPANFLHVDPWPNLKTYFHLVTGFNHRNLTDESDALWAFIAITTMLSKSFPGGFLFGLPVFLFDIGMLWNGYSVKRRRCFPSWSWLGWAGQVHWPFAYNYTWNPRLEDQGQSISVTPLIKWHAVHQDGALQPIDNSYHLYKVDAYDPKLHLPDGWSSTWNSHRKSMAVKTGLVPDVSFKFPTPLFPPLTQDMSHSLSCNLQFEAECCTIPASWSRYTGSLSSDLDLHDGSGNWMGTLGPIFTSHDAYQLVAISRACAARQPEHRYTWQLFDEMERIETIKNQENYFFYNVLCIEWADGIAYRKAVGRVKEEAWLRQDRMVIQVVLG